MPIVLQESLPRDRLQKIDPLFQALRELPEKAQGSPGARECVLEVAPNLPFMSLASAIMTSAFAGYPVAWISTGAGWIKLRAAIPQPPDAPPAPESAAPRRQVALHIGADRLDLHAFAVVPPAQGAGRAELEPVLERSVARGTPDSRELADALSVACRGASRPCPQGMWLTADEGVLYEQVSGVLGAIVATQQGAPAANDAPPEILVSFRRSDTGPVDQRPPTIRTRPLGVSGRIPPEEIQRIIRANFSVFRACYEEGLKRDPKLTGLISVKFVIGRDGHVERTEEAVQAAPAPGAQTPSPRMPDEKVVACVVRAFEKLVFPVPDGGIVTVVYPIMFSPGG